MKTKKQKFEVGQKIYICRESLFGGVEIKTYYVQECDPNAVDGHPFQIGDSMRSSAGGLFMESVNDYYETPKEALNAYIKQSVKNIDYRIAQIKKKVIKEIPTLEKEKKTISKLTLGKCKKVEYPVDYEDCDY